MKKLFILSCLLVPALSFAQPRKIFNERLAFYGPWPVDGNDRHMVHRISLESGVELEYVEQGDPAGVPVIFLHGITDSWHSFESTLEYLPQSIHAFALSQRGHGDSERPGGSYTPKQFAADVAAFIVQKKLGSAVIVGHSMGGLHAQQFAMDFPHLTKGLVILASDSHFANNPGMPEFYQDVLKMRGPISREFMTGFQKATLAAPIDSAYFNLLVEEGMKAPVEVFQSAFTGLMETDLTPQLKTIAAPTLIFWGELDAFCPREGQDVMTANIRKAKLLVYERTGHALHWEHPQRFAADLSEFISDNILKIKTK
jgi:non-heme chloroperoxidase